MKARRGAKLDSRETALFSGEYWTGQRGQELGLVDAIGDLRGVLRERYGDKVRTPLIAERGLFGRRTPGVSRRLRAVVERPEPRRGHGFDARGARDLGALRTVGDVAMPASSDRLALGAIGAVVADQAVQREWQRVNAELDRARPIRCG